MGVHARLHRCLLILLWKLIYTWTYIHMHCTHAYALNPWIWLQYIHICVYVSFHMYVNVCILQECLLNVWKPMVLCLCKCVCVCILITHPVFWESSPWLRGRLWTKSLGKGWGKAFQKERLRDTPETWSPDMPFPFLETVSPSDSEGKMMGFPLIAHPLHVPLCSPLKEVLQRVRQNPQRTERLRKGLWGVKRQFAGMPKWESNSKQNVLLINKKLSLNNAARSPLTPLDLRFASSSSQSWGTWAISPSLSQAP